MGENTEMTAKDVIEYMQKFPEDARMAIIVINMHREKKVCYTEREAVFVEDSDMPALIINIDDTKTDDIAQEVDECAAGEDESAG